MKELGEVREEEEGEEDAVMKAMHLQDFIEVIEVESIPEVRLDTADGQ
jgi:hypothetical protein